MEDLIKRLQIRATVQEYITQLMVQNEITAVQMEDALNYTLTIIKDAILADYSVYAEQYYTKDKMDAMQNLIQSYTEEGKEPQIIDDSNPTSNLIDMEITEED